MFVPRRVVAQTLNQSVKRAMSTSRDVTGLASTSKVCAVLGGQWGDEGKGKLVDVLAGRYDWIARFNGGSNAGHTLVVDGKKHAFQLLPCGLLQPGKKNVIGNGVVLHLPTLMKELDSLKKSNIEYESRLFISSRAHLLFDAHQLIDGSQERALGDSSIGTTKKGIGPCYSSKTTRNGIRVGELANWAHFEQRYRDLIASLQRQYSQFEYDAEAELVHYKQYREIIMPMVTDTVVLLNGAVARGETVLAEGANAALLDLDHGTYPYVSSSSTTAGGVATGLGLAPRLLDTCIGVVKAYTTRVGSGPFPTELEDATGERLRSVGGEFGTITGRPRRCGWLDIPVVQYSHLLNGYDSINISKLDVLSGLSEVKIATHYTINGEKLPAGYMPSTLEELGQVQVVYETMQGWQQDLSNCTTRAELPQEAQKYLTRIEELTGIPVSWVGIGAGRNAMIRQ